MFHRRLLIQRGHAPLKKVERNATVRLLARSLFLLCIALVSLACSDVSYDSVSDADVVYTKRQDNYDFSSYKTYIMSDTIIDLSSETSDPVELDGTYQQDILDATESNLKARGYTRVTDVADADFSVILGVVASYVTTYYYTYPWYGGGYYYPYSTSISYPVGTLVTTIFPAEIEELVGTGTDFFDGGKPEVQPYWLSAIQGLLYSDSTPTTTRINSLIDQSFTQSPYLQSNASDGGSN